MSTSNKLKAYVRFDGSGRVVPSSVILARFKPKVGNYQEIDAYECCNDVPTTTTTTTQGGETPTAWIGVIVNSGPSDTWRWNACNGLGFSTIVYTNSATEPLAPGTALYSDAALTTLIPYNFGVISINGIVYEIVNGYTSPLGEYGQSCSGITTTTTTTTIALIAPFVATSHPGGAYACNGENIFHTGSVYPSSLILEVGTTLWADAELTVPYSTGMMTWLAIVGYPGFAYSTNSFGGSTNITEVYTC